jgi:1,2-phenylacetyl-CoA epoxidase PaaB subunit
MRGIGVTNMTERHRFEDRAMWEVFARRKFEEPLAHVGTVAADDPDLATVYARSIFNEFSWVEMVLYPRAAGLPVLRT